MMRPAIVGKVSTINGNTISVVGRQNQGMGRPAVAPNTTTVTYTVDATNAVVRKNNATSTVSSIAVGDMVMVQGSVNGTNVVATMIRDNFLGIRDGQGSDKNENGENSKGRNSSSTPPAFVGNGLPIVAGKISAISGNSLTVTTAGNVSYVVDATNAKILQGQNTITISNVVVGDTVMVQGTVNGSTITASTVIDRSGAVSTNPNPNGNDKKSGGFFGGIGQFFMHLFGF